LRPSIFEVLDVYSSLTGPYTLSFELVIQSIYYLTTKRLNLRKHYRRNARLRIDELENVSSGEDMLLHMLF
jgi:uncharacterized protein YjbK